MDPGGRQYNQFLAASCNENGKALSLMLLQRTNKICQTQVLPYSGPPSPQ